VDRPAGRARHLGQGGIRIQHPVEHLLDDERVPFGGDLRRRRRWLAGPAAGEEREDEGEQGSAHGDDEKHGPARGGNG
jgi:hypothetical protein